MCATNNNKIKVLEVFAHVRMRSRLEDGPDARGGAGGGPPGGGSGGGGVSSGSYCYYPRAVAAAANLDPWGVGEGLRGALSSAGAALPSAGAAAAAAKNAAVAAVTAAGRGAGGVVGAGGGDASAASSLLKDTIAAGQVHDQAPSFDVGVGAGGGCCGGEDDVERLGPGAAGYSAAATRAVSTLSSSSLHDGALALTTHRVIFVERQYRPRRRRPRRNAGGEAPPAPVAPQAEGDGDDAGTLVEIPLAYIVETKVKRRPSEGLVGVQVLNKHRLVASSGRRRRVFVPVVGAWSGARVPFVRVLFFKVLLEIRPCPALQASRD